MKGIIFFLLVIISAIKIDAQKNQDPCSAPEAGQFDFWIGDWNLEWRDQKGEILHGSNSVRKILGSCVIEENFKDEAAPPFMGKSHSVYNNKISKWQQTWVDNQGGYLDFTGGFSDGKMILSRALISKNGTKIRQRMVFFNISKDSFTWDWENSTDDEKTWNLLWRINYKRKN